MIDEPQLRQIEVAVSITLSKLVTVEVELHTNDYDGYIDLKSAVLDQINLPGDSTWSVDDFEVISNE